MRLENVVELQGPNYVASRATLSVSRDGRTFNTLTPERRVYNVSRQAMTEVAIDRGISRDLYIALGDPVSATAWSVRVHHKPFVNGIWIGCVLMASGGLLAVLDRRYRRRTRAAAEPMVPDPVPAASTPLARPALAKKARAR